MWSNFTPTCRRVCRTNNCLMCNLVKPFHDFFPCFRARREQMEGKALNFGQKGACLKTGNLRSGSKGRSCAICGRLSSPHFANDGKALLGTGKAWPRTTRYPRYVMVMLGFTSFASNRVLHRGAESLFSPNPQFDPISSRQCFRRYDLA